MEETLDECRASNDVAREVFSEVPLFNPDMVGSSENGDCNCFNCDGNPCVK